MKDFRDRVGAITGAGSGIGAALAHELAERGCHVALCDIEPNGLAATVRRCEGLAVKVSSTLVDVSSRAEMFAWADAVVEEHGTVNMIFNNAGVDLNASAEGSTYEDLEWLMGINFWGVVHGTKAFLPHLKASGEGHVINISSVFGLVSIPSQSAYNAAKFGVRGYTDALRIELDIEQCGVSATTIHPGGIKTNIARSARTNNSIRTLGQDPDAFQAEFDQLARTTPDKAARQILRAVRRNRRRALIGPDAVAFDIASRLPAGLYQRLLIQGARRNLRA